MDESQAGRGILFTPELIRDLTVAIGKQDWKPEELGLRKREIRHARRSALTNTITAIATVIAAFAAATAVIFAAKGVNVAQMAVATQAKEARFSTGVQALGADQPTERVAGAIILRHNVQDRLNSAKNAEEQFDAFNLYVTTTTILETYLKTPLEPPRSVTPAGPPAVTTSGQDRPIGAPAAPPGRLDPPLEHVYVAQQLAGLLNAENQKLLHRFNNPRNVSVDLSNVNLSGQAWPKVDFSWVGGAYLYGIDLRAASLNGSKWGNATLTAASLQCANLANSKFNKLDEGNKLTSATLPKRDQLAARLHGAHLQHANLQYADLRFADLTDADLRGAYIDGALFDGAQLAGAATNGVIGASVGAGRLLQGDPKRDEFDIQTCKHNGWDR